LNRTAERAVRLAQELGVEGGALDRLQEMEADIVINATPVGMPIDPSWLQDTEVAMDIKTVPKETEFLKEAKERGCACVYGYEMFLNQAAGQFMIWGAGKINAKTPRCEDAEEIKDALAEIYQTLIPRSAPL